MKKLAYKSTLIFSKILGVWIFCSIAYIVATGYFVLFPRRVRISKDFYKALFPERSSWYHLWCTWKQFQNFTRIFRDRFLLLDFNKVTHNSVGWHHLEKTLAKKEGGIILMSHMGNWEIAAHLLKRRQNNIKLMLYVGTKHKEQIEKMQKDSLAQSGLKIVGVDENGSSPFLLLESSPWMNEGGLVSITGDRLWHQNQRATSAEFLQHEVLLPEGPHWLALITGKPIFILFSFPNGKNNYRIEVSEPIYVTAKKRSERKEAVKHSVQTYADFMEKALRNHPFEWFHFERFLGNKIKRFIK